MAPQPVTLDQASLALPAGVYTTFRTYHKTRVHHFAAHLHRLEESARLSGIPVVLAERLVRRGVREALLLYPEPETRVRLTLDLEVEPGRFFVSVEPLGLLPPESYQSGVRVVTRRMQRENPKAKLTGFISTASALRHELPPGVNEILMVDANGAILEGMSSNFFAVMDREIWTANEGILDGITRRIILAEAKAAGISTHLEDPCLEHIHRYQEAFITSASRSVLPVVQIDGYQIGTGRPGPISEILLQRYTDRILHEVEEI
jgi:branched-chain amino acid aminotransferase